MSNIPNNIKNMWEEAAKIKKPGGNFIKDKTPLHPTPKDEPSYGTVKPKRPKPPESGMINF